MADLVFLEVEEGPNCPLSLQLVYSGLDDAHPVRRVRLYDRGDPTGAWYDVTGWNTDGSQKVHGIFAAVPYCLDLIGAPRIDTNEAVCKAFRPKSASNKPAN